MYSEIHVYMVSEWDSLCLVMCLCVHVSWSVCIVLPFLLCLTSDWVEKALVCELSVHIFCKAGQKTGKLCIASTSPVEHHWLLDDQNELWVIRMPDFVLGCVNIHVQITFSFLSFLAYRRASHLFQMERYRYSDLI